MATLPRSAKFTADNGSLDFDVGINTSVAWTRKTERSLSPGAIANQPPESPQNNTLSDEDVGNDTYSGKTAHVLYPFSGRVDFRELNNVETGDELEILQEHVGEGWSLARTLSKGEIGLLPRDYYKYTSELPCSSVMQNASDSSPSCSLSSSHYLECALNSSSVTDIAPPLPSSLLPQNTGDGVRAFAFPSFKHTLLGGKSLNRFSNFVTSGAEEWILSGIPGFDPEAEAEVIRRREKHTHERSGTSNSELEGGSKLNNEVDFHYIDVGPAWTEKIPPFRILVHSPEKRTTRLNSFMVYTVTTFFQKDTQMTPGSHPLTVYRRFSHFASLHAILLRKMPGIALPPLPEKQYTGRFNKDFIEARRGDLERYLEKLAGHPVIRYAETFTYFLSCESDNEWVRILSQHSLIPPAGPSFYARVYHPAFNVDIHEAEEAAKGFYTHIRDNNLGIQYIRDIFSSVRGARIEISKADRLLSHSLLSLITYNLSSRTPPANKVYQNDAHESPIESGRKKEATMNSEGVWCWREGCKDCLKLSKGLQLTAESIHSIADLYDDHARRTQLATHESLKKMAYPDRIYEGVVSTHQATLSRYRDAIGTEQSPDEGLASRCETVLNVTMAEMEVYHQQKLDDLHSLTLDHLDGEIALYEKILGRLKTSRNRLSGAAYDELASFPRPTTRLERELDQPHLNPAPLPQPYPHIFDSAPMRPVNMAIQELLLGTRAS